MPSRRHIKKHVPLMRRGYFTAYLLREFLNGPVKNQNRERQADRPKRVKTERTTPIQASEPAQAPAHKNKAREPRTPTPEHRRPRRCQNHLSEHREMKRLYAKEFWLSCCRPNSASTVRKSIPSGFTISIHSSPCPKPSPKKPSLN
jgi:hypothetical protein